MSFQTRCDPGDGGAFGAISTGGRRRPPPALRRRDAFGDTRAGHPPSPEFWRIPGRCWHPPKRPFGPAGMRIADATILLTRGCELVRNFAAAPGGGRTRPGFGGGWPRFFRRAVGPASIPPLPATAATTSVVRPLSRVHPNGSMRRSATRAPSKWGGGPKGTTLSGMAVAPQSLVAPYLRG